MLHHAILLKNHKAVKYLVKHGANPNKNGKCQSRSRYSTPYEVSAQVTNNFFFEFYWILPGFYEQDGISELQYAALESDFQSIRLFFDNDGNLARPYPQRNRTVIDDLRLQSNDQDIMNFLTSIFDARLRFAIFPVSGLHIFINSFNNFLLPSVVYKRWYCRQVYHLEICWIRRTLCGWTTEYWHP